MTLTPSETEMAEEMAELLNKRQADRRIIELQRPTHKVYTEPVGRGVELLYLCGDLPTPADGPGHKTFDDREVTCPGCLRELVVQAAKEESKYWARWEEAMSNTVQLKLRQGRAMAQYPRYDKPKAQPKAKPQPAISSFSVSASTEKHQDGVCHCGYDPDSDMPDPLDDPYLSGELGDDDDAE